MHLQICHTQVITLIPTDMNTLELIENWNERKGKLKQKFRFLTENDLMFEVDKKEEMLAKLQLKLGKTKDEMLRIIETL
jgi:uncharacterized protein YjbJ (UPF0337 family)